MTNIERATEHLDSLDSLFDRADGTEPNNAQRAQALADAGLLTPEPHIIRSAEDLMRVDGDSLIATHEEVASTTFGAHYMCYAADPEAMIYPMVVVATGAQVRAARTALQ